MAKEEALPLALPIHCSLWDRNSKNLYRVKRALVSLLWIYISKGNAHHCQCNKEIHMLSEDSKLNLKVLLENLGFIELIRSYFLLSAIVLTKLHFNCLGSYNMPWWRLFKPKQKKKKKMGLSWVGRMKKANWALPCLEVQNSHLCINRYRCVCTCVYIYLCIQCHFFSVFYQAFV